MAHAFSFDDLLILMPNKIADHSNLEILIRIYLSNEETNFEAFQKFLIQNTSSWDQDLNGYVSTAELKTIQHDQPFAWKESIHLFSPTLITVFF